MKSAYELAMERMERASGPSKKLTEAQKAAIAEIEQQIDARIAEARLGLEGRMAGTASPQEQQALREELAAELQRLEERREREKNQVWES